VGKKKHRPKSKAELLQAQWERERTRPPRSAAGLDAGGGGTGEPGASGGYRKAEGGEPG